jgi:hypothetical protein
MASHDDRDVGAIRALINALEHRRRSGTKNLEALVGGVGTVSVFCPVLVVSGELREVPADAEELDMSPCDHVRLRHVVIHENSPRAYSIDVVREPHLPKLLDILEAELAETARRFSTAYRSALEALGIND